jgi:preprotein translocase SecE subunit
LILRAGLAAGRPGESKVSEAVEKGKKKESVGEFVKNTRDEMSRVSFPSGEDVRKTTIIVIINVIFFAIFLFVVDLLWVYFLQGVTWVVNLVTGI